MLKVHGVLGSVYVFITLLTVFLAFSGCGRKGALLPHARTRPSACLVQWSSSRILDVKLPIADEFGRVIVGIEKVRVYYLPLERDRPTGGDIIARGQAVMEHSCQNVTSLNKIIKLNLRRFNYPAGWLTVVAVRAGGIVGVPSATFAWLDSSV